MMIKSLSLNRISISAISLFLVMAPLFAQYSLTDKYYQDRLSSSITIGKELLEAKEVDEGINYLEDAVSIAVKRSHDYYLTARLVNQGAFEPIINYYYSIDSTSRARQNIDLYATLYLRYPNALKNNKTLTERQYAEFLLDCYSFFHALARDNNDNQYAIKYNTLYIETAKTYNVKTE